MKRLKLSTKTASCYRTESGKQLTVTGQSKNSSAGDWPEMNTTQHEVPNSVASFTLVTSLYVNR